jgi:hypothetical protein
MDKEQQLQCLLRLKRHEQPPEDFAESFLAEFQRRQRTDIVRRSALSIVWERLNVWASGLRRPAVVWSAAGAYAVLMLALWLLPRHAPRNDMTVVVGTGGVTTTANVGFTPGVQVQPVTTQHPAAAEIPGKRRTTPQPQDKASVIGETPAEAQPAPAEDPKNPARDLPKPPENGKPPLLEL